MHNVTILPATREVVGLSWSRARARRRGLRAVLGSCSRGSTAFRRRLQLSATYVLDGYADATIARRVRGVKLVDDSSWLFTGGQHGVSHGASSVDSQQLCLVPSAPKNP